MKIENKIGSITIGSFDGLHLAHRELITLAELLVVIERNGGYLTPGYRRTHYTDKPCAFYLFDKVKSLSPQEFVAKLGEDFPQLKKIVVGYDFHFGKGKEGNAQMLRELFDGEVVIVNEVTIEGIPIHSRTIRAYLKESNIEMANKLLGRNYAIEGEVTKGQGVGRKELVPTLNLKVDHYQLPLEGVYATKTKIGKEWCLSVSFLGHRVTTDGSYAIETHVIERDIGEVSGAVRIEFVAFIRKNRKFEALDALKKQINTDIDDARKILL
ncbi:MAG: bifunctional riboflavin kinase/FAD synthetase [Campylobacterota bacterium]|nr:bifunctional riboflavin kinase/FAD synthetase [Campylobacterota bacterium]